jgi:hypothetical protein
MQMWGASSRSMTYAQVPSHTPSHTFPRTYTHTFPHTLLHTHIPSHTLTHTFPHTLLHTHSYTLSYTHTLTHALLHTHIPSHTLTHTLPHTLTHAGEGRHDAYREGQGFAHHAFRRLHLHPGRRQVRCVGSLHQIWSSHPLTHTSTVGFSSKTHFMVHLTSLTPLRSSFSDRYEAFFIDYSLTPLLVQQNYVDSSKAGIFRNPQLSDVRRMELLSEASDSVSDSDLAAAAIRGQVMT